MMELAKNKYHKMIEVRHKSFIEKKQLSQVLIYRFQERQSFIEKHHQSVVLKASRIKS